MGCCLDESQPPIVMSLRVARDAHITIPINSIFVMHLVPLSYLVVMPWHRRLWPAPAPARGRPSGGRAWLSSIS